MGQSFMSKDIVFLIFVVSLVWAALGYVGYWQYQHKKERLSEEIVDVPIGAYTFAFPRNAIASVTHEDDNVRKSRVSLEFILPSLDPVTEKTSGQLTIYNTLTVNLSASHYGGFLDVKKEGKLDTDLKINSLFKEGYFSGAKVTSGHEPLYPPLSQGERIGDLFVYKKKDAKAAGGDIYTNAVGSIKFILDCTTFGTNPICSFDARTLGHLSIHYYYPKKYLPQAEQIHDFVMAYLKSHFVGVTDRE